MGIEKKKLRILSKLAESGIDTEKKVMALDKYALVDFCLRNGLQLLEHRDGVEGFYLCRMKRKD